MEVYFPVEKPPAARDVSGFRFFLSGPDANSQPQLRFRSPHTPIKFVSPPFRASLFARAPQQRIPRRIPNRPPRLLSREILPPAFATHDKKSCSEIQWLLKAPSQDVPERRGAFIFSLGVFGRLMRCHTGDCRAVEMFAIENLLLAAHHATNPNLVLIFLSFSRFVWNPLSVCSRCAAPCSILR